MAAGSDKEIGIKITIDAEGAVKGFESLGAKLKTTRDEAEKTEGGFTRLEAVVTALNSAVQLSITAFNVASGAFDKTFKALNRGDDVANISSNFERLAQQAGAVSSELEGRLLQAVEGTVTRFDLLSAANKGLLLGLSPETLVQFASVSDKLGDAVGVTATQAFETLTQAVGRNKLGLLETLGITADGIDSAQVYADATGKVADQLSKQEKVAADSAVALALIQEKTSGLADVSRGAGENLLIFSNTISDTKDRFLETLSSNAALNETLGTLNQKLRETDFKPFITGASTAATSILTLSDNIGLALNSLGAFLLTESGFKKQLEQTTQSVNQAIAGGRQLSDATISDIRVLTLAYDKLSAEVKSEVTPALQALIKAQNNTNKSIESGATETKGIIKPTSQYEDLLKKIKKSLSDYIKGASDLNAAQKETPKLLRSIASEAEQLSKDFIDGIIKAEQLTTALKALEDQGKAAGLALEDIGRASSVGLRKGGASPTIELPDKKIDDAGLFIDFEAIQNSAGFGLATALAGSAIEAGQLLSDGKIAKNEFAAIGAAVGAVIGAVIGAAYSGGAATELGAAGGAAIGGAVGSIVGDAVALISNAIGKNPATREKKQIDRFFSDLFNQDRLVLVINDELRAIRDLDFFGDDFGSPQAGFFDTLNQATEEVRQGFEDLGLAVSLMFDAFDEIGNNLANVFANNVGASLNNLQILFKQAGLSAEELNEQIINAFNSGELSAIEAFRALESIQEVMANGIPGAVGATNTALQNLFDAGARGGAAAIDALQDIAFEAQEAGLTSLQQAQQLAIESGEFTAEQINAVFSTLAAFGIDSIEDLAAATESQIIAILANLQAQGILEDTTATIADTAAAIEAIPANQEKRVTFIADVQYTDRASTPTGQAVLQSAGAPTKRGEGVPD